MTCRWCGSKSTFSFPIKGMSITLYYLSCCNDCGRVSK